jgi:hypothetical protein
MQYPSTYNYTVIVPGKEIFRPIQALDPKMPNTLTTENTGQN